MDKILSIIVPSYNMEAYLPKCLGSLIVDDKDLLQKLDVIVVNDGSQDCTSEIAHGFESKYPGVFRVIDKTNGHYGSCINAGLAAATGHYIKILDADDWFDTLNFEEYVRLLLSEHAQGIKSADLVLNDFKFVNGEHETLKSYAFVQKEGFRVSDLNFRDGHDVWMHAVAYKTENLKKMGYEQLCGITHTDIQWIHLPMTSVTRMAYFGEPLYFYQNMREGNTSRPEEYYRTYHIQMFILKKMIEEYNEVKDGLDQEHEAYLRNHLLYRTKRAYQVNILERSPFLKKGSLVDFDNYLHDNVKWLYDAAGNLTCSRKTPFHYVQAWRRHQKITPLLAIALNSDKILNRIYRFLGKV